MTKGQFDRTIALIGPEELAKLGQKKVAVFGLGGVGSFAVEALARVGIGQLLLVDKDTIDLSNLNRQLYALHSTIGKAKVDLARQRCLDINPDLKIEIYQEFYRQPGQIYLRDCDYIVDAIDNVTGKLTLIEEAKKLDIPIISSMGTGNKLDNTQFVVGDIAQTQMCPLAKVIRKELKIRGIKGVKVVYSTARPVIKKQVPASISFVPPVAGFLLAGQVIQDLIGQE